MRGVVSATVLVRKRARALEQSPDDAPGLHVIPVQMGMV